MAYDATPAYEQKVWSYEYAPVEYREFFGVPDKPKHKSFIVWDRHIVNKGVVEWVTPDGVWWSLWHEVETHELDKYTTVYLLTEKTASS